MDLQIFLRVLLFGFAAAALTGSAVSDHPLRQQAYIWQRIWTPSLDASLSQSADLVDGWRVLFVEIDHSAQPHFARIDWVGLNRSLRRVVVVIRIDGHLTKLRETGVLDHLNGWIRDIHAHAGNLAGIEIDYDCGTGQLSGYADFLQSVRAAIPPDVRLSITALPDWMNSSHLPSVLGLADESVLQVHAVQNPRLGLFASDTALRWVQSYARVSTKPFWVSLPTYGARISWSVNGALIAIESETPTLVETQDSEELIAHPDAVAGFLRELHVDAPATLRGILWFRLPTADDSRAWSLATWRAVVLGKKLMPHITVRTNPAADRAGVEDVRLVNDGDSDAELPAQLPLGANCIAADGINGYAPERQGGIVSLVRLNDGLIHAGEQRIVGWTRCALP